MTVCGRASTTTPLEQIAAIVGARGPFPPWRPRYNQPPGEPVANVVEANGVRRIEPYVWGIRGRDPKRPYVNVRAESVPKSKAFASRRSLVFVDGFFEWDKQKRPYYIRRRDRAPFALGAVYDESPERRRFAIITTSPNKTVGQVHNRMPAIIPPEAWPAWLDPQYPDDKELRSIMRPSSDDPLLIYPVSKLVNSPRNDRPELIQPDPEARAAELEEKIFQHFERREFTTSDVARELQISDDEAEATLQNMRGLDHRLAKWWFTKWKR